MDRPIATDFDVTRFPATFSIDADGVLEDQHVGDENIEGRLKKMIAHAVEVENSKPASGAHPRGFGRRRLVRAVSWRDEPLRHGSGP